MSAHGIHDASGSFSSPDMGGEGLFILLAALASCGGPRETPRRPYSAWGRVEGPVAGAKGAGGHWQGREVTADRVGMDQSPGRKHV